MTFFRAASVVVALAGVASMAASQAVIETTTSEGHAQMLFPTCEVNVNDEPKTFSTVYVTAEELTSFLETDLLEGPCTDYLGELCSDGLKCTIDYDYDNVKCLPLGREPEPDCEELE